ncbi:MAG TPA: hypothetical protein VGO47_00955 [Chlamydiales bacterium]|nr:hypothetical protein [Chlamydiales bacterium]
MQVHNAIVILQEILPVFPVGAVNNATGAAIADAMTKCIEKEIRLDLKILANSYNAKLLKAKTVWEAPVPGPGSVPQKVHITTDMSLKRL